MPAWHIGALRSMRDTECMIIAKPFADDRASNDPVISLIGEYRERGDRRAIERILALNVKIVHHLAGRYSRSSNGVATWGMK